LSYGSNSFEEGTQKAEVSLSDDAQQASPLFFNLPFRSPNGTDGEIRTLEGNARQFRKLLVPLHQAHR
jgi:hypothetical protein